MIKRCNNIHPILRLDNGVKVRCTLLKNHLGPHFNSFVNRKWRQ